MNIQQVTQEINRLHIDHSKLLSMIVSSLSSSGEAGVLLWLKEQRNEVFAIDIIDHFGLTPGRVANIVKKLEERGYIEREHSNEDLRKSHIHLTESGMDYASELYDRMAENHYRMLDALGEEDANHILRILQKIILMYDNAN